MLEIIIAAITVIVETAAIAAVVCREENHAE